MIYDTGEDGIDDGEKDIDGIDETTENASLLSDNAKEVEVEAGYSICGLDGCLCNTVQGMIGCGVFVLCAAITVQSLAAGSSHIRLPPWANFLLLTACLILMGYLEGFHVTVVILEKAAPDTLAAHPRAAAVHATVTASPKRFLIGRQVLLTTFMFLTAEIMTFDDDEHEAVLFVPARVVRALLISGLAGSVLAFVLGSLAPQLLACSFPIAHFGLPGAGCLASLIMLLERTGVAELSCFLAELLQAHTHPEAAGPDCFAFGSGVVFQPGGSSDAPDDASEAGKVPQGPPSLSPDPPGGTVYIAKCVGSTVLAGACLWVGGWRLLSGHSALVGGDVATPWVAALVLGVVLLLFGALVCLEGMNIAVLALEKATPESLASANPSVRAFHASAMTGPSVRRFLVGRQFVIVYCDFIMCKLLGLWGILPVILIAQVFPQLVAASSPTGWMALPGARAMFWLCRVVEATGLGHAGWALSKGLACLVNSCGASSRNEVYGVGKTVHMGPDKR